MPVLEMTTKINGKPLGVEMNSIQGQPSTKERVGAFVKY
jgi:hypothetical protein